MNEQVTADRTCDTARGWFVVHLIKPIGWNDAIKPGCGNTKKYTLQLVSPAFSRVLSAIGLLERGTGYPNTMRYSQEQQCLKRKYAFTEEVSSSAVCSSEQPLGAHCEKIKAYEGPKELSQKGSKI
jgi:hypothetical protein